MTASWYYHTSTSVRKEQIEEKHKKDIEKLKRKIEAVKGRLKKNLKAQKTLRDRVRILCSMLLETNGLPDHTE